MKYKSFILSIIGFSSIVKTNGITESPTMVPAFQTFSPTLSSLSPTTSPTSSPTATPTLEIVEREIINDVSGASDEINHAILLKCIVLFNTVCILLRYV